MSDDFTPTVDLKKKREEAMAAARGEKPAPKPKKKKKKREEDPAVKLAESKAQEIDKVFADRDDLIDEELQQISRPSVGGEVAKGVMRTVIMAVLAIAVIAAGFYFLFMRDSGSEQTETYEWVTVFLNDGDIYYGQVADKAANPIVLKNVYYNYDQLNKEAGTETSETGNIKLVKRGNETHGPSGEMQIYQAQIKLVETFSTDSKVLDAILENEGDK